MKKKLAALLALCLTLTLTVLPAAALEAEDAKQLLAQYYVDGVPEDVMELDSLEEILEALDDPYTTYMSAEEYQKFLSAVNGETVVGIGVSVQNAFDNGFRIMSILPDSPALEAGLEAGDRIIAVDGQTLTDGMDIQSAIGGAEGTQVTITVVSQSDGQTRDYTLVRRSVEIPIVTYEQVGDAGYIDCSSFGESTPTVVGQALEELDDDVALWVMDLRSNPGGTDRSATLTAGQFVGSAIMVYFRDANDIYYYEAPPAGYGDLTDKPLVILTSPYSASGSELFAAAIRDHGAGVAVGQRTYGKGVAQVVFDAENRPDLFDGDCLKVTVYRFYSPDGVTNHEVGVLPSLLVSMEHTAAVARLLSAAEPSRASGYLKLELAGQTLYVDLAQAEQEGYQAAFDELLEAIPPAAVLYRGTGSKTWTAVEPADLARELENRESLFPFLVTEIQKSLGKVLSAADLKALYTIYDYLALPAEVIFILVNHCIAETERKYGAGRRPRMSQIKREAYRWVQAGADTVQAADAYLKRLEAMRTREDELLPLLGIRGRRAVEGERKYMTAWIDWGFPDEAVALAYERTVLRKGSLNWAYMNSILKNWHAAGLHTVEQIQAGDGRGQRWKQRTGAAPQNKAVGEADQRAREDMERMRRFLEQEKKKAGEI